ncbi:MAG: PilZ domain-containing protein [Candidatus Omnitrophica bacterium]|nr:PilZ domain-containing protein [Candidatus Omnitrophota bacterium]
MRERRDFHRITQAIEGRYRASGHFGALGASMTLVNLSAGGLRFRSEEQLEKDALLEVEVKIPGFREPLIIKGRVAWSTLQASGVVETGVEFLNVSPDLRCQIDSVIQFFRPHGQAGPPPAAAGS